MRSMDREIGMLDNCPPVDAVFVLAGHAWKVRSSDEERKIIYVYPVESGRIPRWSSSEGGGLHRKIVQRIRRLLLEDEQYAYMRPNALELLLKARQFAREANILQCSVIPQKDKSFLLCPWVGTKELKTLCALFFYGFKDALQIYSLALDDKSHHLHIVSDLSLDEFIYTAKKLEIDIDNPDVILPKEHIRKTDKYDMMVPDELLRKAYLYNEMDVRGAIQVLEIL